MTREQESYTCDKHLTEPRPQKLERTLKQKRLGFEFADLVSTNEEYFHLCKKFHENGTIISFSDPCFWETSTSVVFVIFSCGCKMNINVGWLKKIN